MDQREVLVHVTAPSRLRDDRNYHSLADEIARFETAAVTHVYGFVVPGSTKNMVNDVEKSGLDLRRTMTEPASREGRPTPGRVTPDLHVEVSATPSPTSDTQMKSAAGTNAVAQADCLGTCSDSSSIINMIQETPDDRREREPNLEDDMQSRSRIKPKWLGQWQVVKGEHSEPTTYMRRVSNNPPFKNPFHGTTTPNCVARSLHTPELIRPRTAPAGGTGTIQVPRSLNPAHKRSASDSFLDGSFGTASTVPDSHPSSEAEIGRSDSFLEAFHADRATTAPPNTSFTLEPSIRRPVLKRRRLTVFGNRDSDMKDVVEADVISTQPIESSFERNFLVRPPPGCKGPYFLRDRSEDWTSPPEPSVTDSSSNAVSSTLSPSQPLALRLSQTRISPPLSPHPPLAVDLTSDSPSTARSAGERTEARKPSSPSWPGTRTSLVSPSNAAQSSPDSATRNFYHTSSPPVRTPKHQNDRSSRIISTNDSRRCDFTSSIRSLPDQIQAPPPPVGSGSFTTHVSSALSAMIVKLPLSRHFRPVAVTRNVHVLERGHWLIKVKIASEEDVAEARRPLTQGEFLAALQRQTSATTSAEREKRYEAWKAAGEDLGLLGLSKRRDLWTQNEFHNFWEVLTKYVEDGKAGHGVTVAKDWSDKDLTSARALQSTYARVRVYTWGEVLGHMWIALWVLSDKKTAYVPMEWISTDDSVVVKMSGNRHKGGKLGPWVPKGSPGEKGSWGIQESTPPGNQGKCVRRPSS